MEKEEKLYQQELFRRLFQSQNLKKEIALFNQLFGQAVFWIAAQANIDKLSPLNGNFVCLASLGKKRKRCLECISRILNKAKKSRQIERFVCPTLCHGICLPLVQGDALYGFLILCHLKTAPSLGSLHLFEALNNTILEKVQKELELSKLYRTIRPRAVALSTIHTIRRLISSSLDLEELLPRIARLSLQVLRARRCIISLVDKKTKHLLPKAIIDISKKKMQLRVSDTIRRIENKVKRTGNILLKKSSLSVPLIDEEPIGVISVFDKTTGKAFDNFDQEILNALAEQAVGAIMNAQLYKEQEDMLLGTVKALSTLLKVKSASRYTHSKLFVDLALALAKELGLSEESLRNLRFAAMLHDAGEIGIPEEILKKPAQLTGKELKIVKQHPKESIKILSPLERLKPAIAIILHHHEKFDGTGYPDGLKGEQIPLEARIMAVVDSFEAMISRRPYRKSTSIAEAYKEIKRNSATQFDPRVVKAFLKLMQSKSVKELLKGASHVRPKKGL